MLLWVPWVSKLLLLLTFKRLTYNNSSFWYFYLADVADVECGYNSLQATIPSTVTGCHYNSYNLTLQANYPQCSDKLKLTIPSTATGFHN
jgi:hypothetical protein